MILEIEQYVNDNKLTLLVSDILGVEIKHKSEKNTSVLGEWQFSVIVETSKRTYDIWYNGDRKKAEATYNQIKEALSVLHKKDSIKDELLKQLKELNKYE